MIEIISGTNRPDSQTRKMANLVLSLYKAQGTPAQILDLVDMPAELFSPASYGTKPASFAPMSDRILACHGIHMIVPEYNGSFPGALKYFIDMLKFPESFEHRSVAYVGLAAGVWGGIRAVEQLQMIFAYRNAFNLPHRVWVAGIHKKWNADFTALNDELAMTLLKDQAKRFAVFTEQHRGEASKG